MIIRWIMDKYIDLHTHSNYSDGTDSPEELVRKAKSAGLSAVALTDHDNTAGLDEFAAQGRARGVETVAGIEISTQMGGVEAHFLGFFIDHNSEPMKAFLVGQERSRREKMAKTLARLREIGFDITENDFSGSKGIVTRGSIAGVMHEKGFVRYKKEAFEKYIGEGRPAFVDRERVGAGEAVELILRCGGVPALAHPYLYDMGDVELESWIRRLADLGLKGIEALYPEGHTREKESFYRYLAGKYGLLITGGSDYHGNNKTVALGFAANNERIPYPLLEDIRRVGSNG